MSGCEWEKMTGKHTSDYVRDQLYSRLKLLTDKIVAGPWDQSIVIDKTEVEFLNDLLHEIEKE